MIVFIHDQSLYVIMVMQDPLHPTAHNCAVPKDPWHGERAAGGWSDAHGSAEEVPWSAWVAGRSSRDGIHGSRERGNRERQIFDDRTDGLTSSYRQAS